MLESIRKHTQSWIAKLILALITIPFALWGIDSYLQYGGDAAIIAKVDGQKISTQEFSQALREQEQRLRSMLGGSFDQTLLDRMELRGQLLDNLINQRVLLLEAGRAGYAPADAELASIISSLPAFQEQGQFSKERYEALLRSQGMTPQIFEARLKREIMIGQVREGVTETTFVANAMLEHMVRIGEQQREVSQAMFSPEQQVSQVKLEPAAVRAYYDQHQDEFKLPEQVRLEYVVLSLDNLMAQVNVSDTDVKKYYEEHASQYQAPEERRASHILIGFPAGGTAAAKAAARAQAEQILKQVRENPARFAELAKRYSQDPGSAEKGGDLGFFTRGMMVKPFEDAVYGMKPGEIAGPVESEFGVHIIKLTAVKSAGKTSPDKVRNEIVQALKKQEAGRKFAEAAEAFSNVVYEKPDSLQPAAQAFGLAIQTSPWLGKRGGGEGMLSNEKLLLAVFSDDALKQKRNTEAIEGAPNTLVSARVIEHKAASVRPFGEISGELSKRLQREQAAALAVQRGKETLAQLQQGKSVAGIAWSASQVVSRQRAQSFGEAAIGRIFKAGAQPLPSYAGMENQPGGFTLFRISRVIEGGTPDAAKKKAYADRLRQITGQESFSAYLKSLRNKADIKIIRENLEKSER